MKIAISNPRLIYDQMLAVNRLLDKNSTTIFGFIKLTANERVTVTATNGSQTVVVEIAGEVIESGEVLVCGKPLLSLLERLNIAITLSAPNGASRLTVVGNEGTFELPLALEDFPNLPLGDGQNFEAQVNTNSFVDALAATEYAASNDPFKQLLCGVNFQWEDSKLTLIATDSHRCAVTTMEVENTQRANFTVPRIAIAQVLKAIDKSINSEQTISLSVEDEVAITFKLGKNLFQSRLLVGQYPDCLSLFPPNFT